MKNFVKKLLPVSLSRFALLSKDVEDIKTNMLCASEARSIHDELHWDVSVQLLNEVKALRDDLKSHDERVMLFAWEGYRKEGESLIEAKKRFFTSLPAATGGLRLLQLGLAKLLADFDSLCRDNDIPYFATCGTLLGAARHSGFIPWDDDIDLNMIRPEYEKLMELYEKNELTSVINRIVEDINHRFTLEVLTRDFSSHDLRVSAKNLRKDKMHPTDILDQIDIVQVNQTLKELLEIRDQQEQSVKITDAHRKEIKEYLDLLDLTVEIENRWMTDFNKKETRTVFSQPGMRYSQAEALIKSLIQDNRFRNLSFNERKRVTERILDEVKGRMMEDIVLLETKLSKKKL